ncbi:peptidase C39 [Lacrimispora sp. 210928-DFI.3.58]|uniref:peptidase C39 n=1 Tax=Lacrimispora sp. 210928-DFI.3.58 TaxID=2883214 RepID=UPI001D08EAE8|nr:peptidase C39 [Lacrimispora sp. 210928-DFI.3.58]MCB7320653.1 peptidase C39 [Lacrimispora sp. 210928-DFI.3.58]
MKNPLRYQMSEYDCGPTSMLNGISYLFEREEIPPEVIRNIMLYCLDCYNAEGVPGKCGTSMAAMMFLSNWLCGFGKIGRLNISSQYLSGKSVFLGQESRINDALRRRGVAVVRLYYEVEHYVLLTGEQDGVLLMFDPYYWEESYEEADIRIVKDHPCSYNRIVPASYFNRESKETYSLGPYEGREAVLLFNEKTKMTPERTIEYFI